ncbi:GroES-like protein [Pleurostoma richardsiae]|uniref:GroES-like protein n=1 Tax=Pleurostoma richardsiae TaxID=41990 RepID=A0AA38RR63_9PEZI|nr:GroES-like protein [Pleurostoma richardsiae]
MSQLTIPSPLPPTMKALVCEAISQPLTLKDVPTPDPVPGSVVVKVIAALVDQNLPRILSGVAGFTFPTPMTPGGRAIGRVAAIGIDTSSLEPGQLVMLEPMIHARDNPNVKILWAASDSMDPRGHKLMRDNWAMAAFAEYVRAPLENCWPLNEARFCGQPEDGGMGLEPYDLLHLPTQLTVYGGLHGIGLQPGERVIVAPATGIFSGAAVAVASAMGAHVIAASRNIEILKKLQAMFPRVSIVRVTGNLEEDTVAMKKFGPVDAVIDVSPPIPVDPKHTRSAIMALENYGRVSLMGGIFGELPATGAQMLWKSLTIRGQYMYERADIPGFLRLAESGLLKLGKEGGVEIVGKYPLEEIDKAFETAKAKSKAGQLCMVTP